MGEMKYEDIAQHAKDLSYREKLKLAQLLLQLAMKEEEEQNPDKRKLSFPGGGDPSDNIEYVAARLLKLRPVKKEGVLNSIAAMYQFQGGISDADKERIFSGLVKQGYIRIEPNKRVSYPAGGEA
jgi:hypothetical protein